jgi:UDP-glucuronate decarboxylase
MKRILVTGGAGNVGGALARALIKDPGNDVTIVDNLVTSSLGKLPSRDQGTYEFINADVNDYQDIASVMTSTKFDYVFHYAALVGVQRTLQNPMRVLNDIDGIKNVLRLAKNTGVRRVFYSSSSEVYGEPVEFPQHEVTTPLNSRLPYAIVKNVGEAFFRSFYQEYGLNYTVFRFFNTYGPGQSSDFVIMKFIQAALKGSDITLFGEGRQTRTFCYIDDNIEATEKILNEDLCLNTVINLGSDIEYPIIEVAKLVKEITQSKSPIVHLPALTEGDMTRRQPDISKMRTILRRELTPLRVGIQKILKCRFNFDAKG